MVSGTMGRQHKASSERSQPSGGGSNRPNRNRISSSSRSRSRSRSRSPNPNSTVYESERSGGDFEIGRRRGRSSWGRREYDYRKGVTFPCRYFAKGRCCRGPNCPYVHDKARKCKTGGGVPKRVVSQLPKQSCTPILASADSINNDKVYGSEGKGTPSAINNQSMQIWTHAANPLAVENLGQTAQGSKEENHQIPGETALPVTIHLPNAPTKYSWALNDFQVHGGQYFNAGQFLQNHPIEVYAEQTQATPVDITKKSQDAGAERIYNSLPVYPNVQIQSQSLQGLSTGKSYMPLPGEVIRAPIHPNPAATDAAAHSAISYFAHVNGNPAGPAVLKQSDPNLNPVFIAAPPAGAPVAPWHWAQQHADMTTQQASFVPVEHQLPVTLDVGSSLRISSVNSSSDLVINEVMRSEKKAGEDKDADADADVKDEDMKKKEKEERVMYIFKDALATFVKGEFRPAYELLQLSKKQHNITVRKVVHKVIDSVDVIPDTEQKVNDYITNAREKIIKILENELQESVVAMKCLINGIARHVFR